VNLRAHGSSLSLRRRRLTLAALIALAALAAALVGLMAFFAARAEAVPDSYGWQVGCRYSHVNQDDAIVWPGHGPQTTIGHERRTNPFLVER